MLEQRQSMVDPADPAGTMLGEVIVEFGRHLDMLAEQLGASLMEADREFVSVAESFHDLSIAKGTIEGVACPEPEDTVLRDSCKQIGSALHTAVVALQYHDRLSQRLGLVRASLLRLQNLLQDRSQRSYEDWLRSLHDVEQTNRTERKRLGAAAEQLDGPQPRDLSDSSIELF